MGQESLAKGCRSGDCDNKPAEGEKFCAKHGGQDAPREVLTLKEVRCDNVVTDWNRLGRTQKIYFSTHRFPSVQIMIEGPASQIDEVGLAPNRRYEIRVLEVPADPTDLVHADVV